LCDMQVRGRAAEMQFVCDGHEIAQMAKLHIYLIQLNPLFFNIGQIYIANLA
jgi:hypothetical protein